MASYIEILSDNGSITLKVYILRNIASNFHFGYINPISHGWIGFIMTISCSDSSLAWLHSTCNWSQDIPHQVLSNMLYLANQTVQCVSWKCSHYLLFHICEFSLLFVWIFATPAAQNIEYWTRRLKYVRITISIFGCRVQFYSAMNCNGNTQFLNLFNQKIISIWECGKTKI